VTRCSVIIVVHDSGRVIHKAVKALREQTKPADKIVLVDTGSKDPSYLEQYEQAPDTELLFAGKEVGFCRGNNCGLQKVPPESDYVFFLNPDAFLAPDFIEKALAFMEKNLHVGMATGKTLGYDLENDRPSGRYDTTGIFHKWYGRWYDRGQGILCSPELYNEIEPLPAICGAVMFARKKALDQALLQNGELFDSSFFMYKEDIDLSLRLRAKKWQLIYNPELVAYHCRGWDPDRKKMPRRIRLCSARNELRIHARTFAVPGIAYSALKYLSVKLLNL